MIPKLNNNQINTIRIARFFKHSWAVTIGINDYSHGIPRLYTAVDDAIRFESILEEDHGFEVLSLVENVTREEILKLLKETLPGLVGNQDRFLFYFAGHGIAVNGDDGPTGYLVPQEARPEDPSTFLAMHEVHQALTSLPCRHLLAILDCCFAGAFRWSSTRDIQPLPEVIHWERFERFVLDPAWQLITSADYDQKALDIISGDHFGARGETQKQHSPFASALFEALSGPGDVVPAGEGDGVITATELYLFLRDHVEVRSMEDAKQRQTPALWPLNKHDKGEFIFLVPGREVDLPPAPPLNYETNPYLGLQAYEEEHKNLFFGRDELIEELAEHVVDSPFTVVVGSSGTGKSSLIKAGLVPYLGEAIQKDSWHILPAIRPGSAPLKSLQTAINALLTESNSSFGLEGPLAEQIPLNSIVQTWSHQNPGKKLLLIVDQFEELITQCYDVQQRERFLESLAGAILERSDFLRVVLTLRADFEPQFADTALNPIWFTGRFTIRPMTQDELRQVIEGPASERVMYFEPVELIDELINEVILTPGALPLLSFTLSEIYIKYLESRRDNRALSREDYHSIGGVVGSIRNRANEEFNALDEAHQEILQRIMLRMIAVEGGEIARRSVSRSELVYPDKDDNQRVEKVLNNLVDARLLIKGIDENKKPFVEPAHDALVHAWEKLLKWRQEAEEYLPLQRRVAYASQEWDHTEDPRSKERLLWNNSPRLSQIEQMMMEAAPKKKEGRGLFRQFWSNLLSYQFDYKRIPWLNQLETDFIAKGIRRRARDLRRLVGITLSVFIALLILTTVAFVSRNDAVESQILAENSAENARHSEATAVMEANFRSTAQALEAQARVDAEISEANALDSEATAIAEANIRATAQALEAQARADAEENAALSRSRELAVRSISNREDQLDLALLLAVEAYDLYPNLEAQSSILGGIGHSAYPMKYLRGHDSRVYDLVFGPNGDFLISADHDKRMILWDTNEGVPIGHYITQEQLEGQPLSGHLLPIGVLALSEDGEILVSSDGNSVIYWDFATHESISEVNLGVFSNPWASAISPDLQYYAGGSFGSVSVWEIATGEEILGPISVASLRRISVAFNPDGSLLAATGGDNHLSVWNLTSGAKVFEIGLDEFELITSLRFDTDGQRLAVGTSFSRVNFYSADSGELVRELIPGNEGPINALAFDPGNRWLASGDSSGRVVITNIAGTQLNPIVIKTESVDIQSLEFNPVGSKLAAGLSDGQVLLWDLTAPAKPGEMYLSELGIGVFDVAYSPDGSFFALADSENQILLWDAEAEAQIGPPLVGHQDRIETLAFDSSGKLLASGSWDGEILLWDVLQGQPLGQPFTMHSGIVEHLAFSADSSFIISASGGGEIIFWDIETRQPLKQLEGNAAVLSPDGHTIAIQDAEYDVIFLDAATFEPTGIKFDNQISMNAIVFSPDSKMVAISNAGRIIQVFQVGDGQLVIELLSGHTSMVGELAFSPDGNILASNSYDGTIILWDVQTWSQMSSPLHGATYSYFLAFHPEGSTLLSDGRGRLVRWDFEIDAMRQAACQVANRNLTQQEWDLYIGPQILYEPTCPETSFTQLALERMLLSQTELGSIGIDLEPDGLMNGQISNERLALETMDPEDTAKEIAQRGRITGFRGMYRIPNYYSAFTENYEGLLRVTSWVEVYTDPASIQGDVEYSLDFLNQVTGEDVNGIVILSVETFPAIGLGDQAWGVLILYELSNGMQLTQTSVSFSHGDIAGSISILRSDAHDDQDFALELAERLLEKIFLSVHALSDPQFELILPLIQKSIVE